MRISQCDRDGHQYAMLGYPYSLADGSTWTVAMCPTCGDQMTILVVPPGGKRINSEQSMGFASTVSGSSYPCEEELD